MTSDSTSENNDNGRNITTPVSLHTELQQKVSVGSNRQSRLQGEFTERLTFHSSYFFQPVRCAGYAESCDRLTAAYTTACFKFN